MDPNSSAPKLTPRERRELPDRGDENLRLLPIDPSIASFDRHVRRLINDLPVPESLRRRVKATMQERHENVRNHRRRRGWAAAVVGLAASLLVAVVMQPFFGRPPLDSDVLAGKLESIHRVVIDEAAPLTAVVPTSAWPKVINPNTCAGQKMVEFLGKQMPAYQLASGADRATLLIVPARQFPFQLGRPHVAVTHSANNIVTHYFVSGRQVCILIVREGTEIGRFHSSESLT
ncbi:hypothetical protein K2X85_10630 [bacterium]|jgi:hypothetical protein|nr:hypothetical protein [bacterium]